MILILTRAVAFQKRCSASTAKRTLLPALRHLDLIGVSACLWCL